MEGAAAGTWVVALPELVVGLAGDTTTGSLVVALPELVVGLAEDTTTGSLVDALAELVAASGTADKDALEFIPESHSQGSV